MYRLFVIAATMLSVIFLSACANPSHVDNQAKNQFVTEFYAWVENVEKIQFKSYAGHSAAIGAVDGLLNNARGNRQDMLAGAIIGGLFGGLLTALFEGNTKGYEYQLVAVDGDIVSVIVDKKPAVQGQCVSVRVAGDVRIKLERMATCDEAAQEYSRINTIVHKEVTTLAERSLLYVDWYNI